MHAVLAGTYASTADWMSCLIHSRATSFIKLLRSSQQQYISILLLFPCKQLGSLQQQIVLQAWKIHSSDAFQRYLKLWSSRPPTPSERVAGKGGVGCHFQTLQGHLSWQCRVVLLVSCLPLLYEPMYSIQSKRPRPHCVRQLLNLVAAEM